MAIFAFIGAAWWAFLIAAIVGVLAFLLAMSVTNGDGVGWGVGLFFVFGAVAFGVCAGISSYATVPRGNIGMVTQWGALTGQVFEPGLNWKSPFIQGVELVDTTQQAYETSELGSGGETNAQWPDFWTDSRTNDGQRIWISTTTIFRIPKEHAVEIRNEIGPVKEVVENVVKANLRSIARNEAKNWRAEDLYSENVLGYQKAVEDQLREAFQMTGHGVELVSVLVRDVTFTEEYGQVIENKQIAKEQIAVEENRAEAAKNEAKRTANLAEGEAKAKVIAAQADADAVRLGADAEAYALEQRGTALKKYPAVLQQILYENLSNQTVWFGLPDNQSLLLQAP